MSRFLLLLPEVLVVATAVAIGLMARFQPATFRSMRSWLPAAVAAILVVALAVELTAGAAVGSYLGGGLLIDRFALFVKAASLVATAAAVLVVDWSEEEPLAISLAMPLFATFGLMVAASAGDLVGAWAGLELSGLAAVVLVAVRRRDAGLRLLLTGGVASALLLIGLVFVYASSGRGDFNGMSVSLGEYATLPLAIPMLLVLGGLLIRMGVAPAQLAGAVHSGAGGTLGAGVTGGLAAAAALVVAIKLAVAFNAVAAGFAPYLELIGAVAMVGGGLAAIGTRSLRALIASLSVVQLGWGVAGLAIPFRSGVGSSLFLLGAFVIAATAAPAALGVAEDGLAALAGIGGSRPARAAGFSLALLSLAGVPPLAGFFGEFALAASLARNGNIALLALGLLGTLLGAVAAVRVVRAVYFEAPLDEARRSAAVRTVAWTRLSAGGAVLLCALIAAYGILGTPILSLADQGAEALGLR